MNTTVGLVGENAHPQSFAGSCGEEKIGKAWPSRHSLKELAPTVITRSGKKGDRAIDRT
jgi:hypothetical protein